MKYEISDHRDALALMNTVFRSHAELHSLMHICKFSAFTFEITVRLFSS